MKLSNNIKLIIQEHGVETLRSNNFVSILDDYKSFGDDYALKSILKSFIAYGYINEYLDINQSNSDFENKLRKLIDEIKRKTGFSEDLLYIVVNEFQEALNHDRIERPNSNKNSSDNCSSSNPHRDKLYAGGIDMDATMQDVAMQFVHMGYSVKSMENNLIELLGIFSGIENTTVRVKGNDKGETLSISALLPISTPTRDIVITRQMAKQFTAANGLPKVANDFFDSCEIIGNCYFNTADSSRPPFFSRWDLSRGYAVIIYTPFNIEFTVSKGS